MRLALESGRPEDVDVLAERLSSHSLMGWQAYFQAVNAIAEQAATASPPAGQPGRERGLMTEAETDAFFRRIAKRQGAA